MGTVDLGARTAPVPTVRVGRAAMRLLAVAGAVLLVAALWAVATGRYLVAVGATSWDLRVADLPQVAAASEGTAVASGLPLWVRALAWFPQALLGVALVAIALWTLRALGGFGRGEFFSPRVVSAVHRAGLTALVAGLVYGAVDSFASFVFSAQRTDQPDAWGGVGEELVFTGGSWPVALVVVGIIALAVAAAFREGARLKDEVRGLV